jgi:hypothetical protein
LTQARATPWSTNVSRSPPWTPARRPDAGLDAWDERGVAAGDILDAAGDLLVGGKFRLSATSILSVFAKIIV